MIFQTGSEGLGGGLGAASATEPNNSAIQQNPTAKHPNGFNQRRIIAAYNPDINGGTIFVGLDLPGGYNPPDPRAAANPNFVDNFAVQGAGIRPFDADGNGDPDGIGSIVRCTDATPNSSIDIVDCTVADAGGFTDFAPDGDERYFVTIVFGPNPASLTAPRVIVSYIEDIQSFIPTIGQARLTVQSLNAAAPFGARISTTTLGTGNGFPLGFDVEFMITNVNNAVPNVCDRLQQNFVAYSGSNVDAANGEDMTAMRCVYTRSVCCTNGVYTNSIPTDVLAQNAYGWSATLVNSADDGLVVTNLSLHERYVSEAISVPYFTILTAKMVQAGTNAQRGELRPNDPEGTPMRSRLVDFQQTNNFNLGNGDGTYSVQATYRIDEIPGSPGSSLCIFQRYEFLNTYASRPLEPSGQLDAQVVRPIVSYCFTNCGGDSIVDLNIPQRQAFWLDKATNNSTSVFKDVAWYQVPFYLGYVSSLFGNPLPTETLQSGVYRGAQGDWDNIHVTFLDSIQEPILDLDAFDLPHAASEAIHMHWRWAVHADLATVVGAWRPTHGNPLIRDGSDQDLLFAVVRHKSGEEDPMNYVHLVNSEPLTSGRQVVWLEGIGHQNQDEFFRFGFGLEDHINYLTNEVTTNASIIVKDWELSAFTGTVLVTLGVANNSRYALMKGPVYLVLNLPSGTTLLTTPTGTNSFGKPYFRLDNLGRDGVLHPKSRNFTHGEETSDGVEVEISILDVPTLGRAWLESRIGLMWNYHQVFAEMPPPTNP